MADEARLTRVRLEASGPTTKAIQDRLYEAAQEIKASSSPSQWEEEKPMEFQTTAKGYWGYVTIRRKDG